MRFHVRSLVPTVLCLALASGVSAGQTPTTAPAPCTAAEHRQFDFWIGEWAVTTPDGKPAGRNRITAILNGCVLLEEWTGAGGGAGKSFNLFDARQERWQQTWVDGRGGILELHGGLTETGAMVLAGDRPAGPGVPPVRHRITWTPRSATEVRQLWETSNDGGATWTTVFDGAYRKVQ
jgi:hypothetical protein